MKRISLICALVLILMSFFCNDSIAEGHGKMIFCSFSIFGGMENEHYSLTLTPGDDADTLTMLEQSTMSDNEEITKTYPSSQYALQDLQEYIEQYAPEAWRDLPRSEYIALDAPTTLVRVVYEDDSMFTITDDLELPEGSGNLFSDVQCFMESYTADSPETFELILSSYDGGGPVFYPSISAPEKIDWSSHRVYAVPFDPLFGGYGYNEVFVFRGRIPGIVELTIDSDNPLIPIHINGEGNKQKVYILRIDNEFNVICEEEILR